MNICDMRKCKANADMVFLTICAQGHIDEFLLCAEHTVQLWVKERYCRLLHPVVEHMAGMLNGEEPKDPQFYPGEWVATKDNQVIKHGGSASDLYRDPEVRYVEGASIFRVEK